MSVQRVQRVYERMVPFSLKYASCPMKAEKAFADAYTDSGNMWNRECYTHNLRGWSHWRVFLLAAIVVPIAGYNSFNNLSMGHKKRLGS